jgi:hypothetical protein
VRQSVRRVHWICLIGPGARSTQGRCAPGWCANASGDHCIGSTQATYGNSQASAWLHRRAQQDTLTVGLVHAQAKAPMTSAGGHHLDSIRVVSVVLLSAEDTACATPVSHLRQADTSHLTRGQVPVAAAQQVVWFKQLCIWWWQMAADLAVLEWSWWAGWWVVAGQERSLH